MPKNRITRRPNSASISFPSGVRMADSGPYYCYVVSEEAKDDNYGQVSNALVCSMHLEVGRKPSKENVTLDCISESYENLICSWTTPNYGTPVNTSLMVMYVGNRAAECPIQLSPNSCQWTMTSTPPYRQVAKKLVMILRVTNKYGSVDIGKTISHFSIVRPGRPVDLAVHDLQSKRMTLSWGKPYAFEHLDSQDDDVPHLMFNVKVSGVKSGKVFSDTNMTETSIDLQNLTPWTEYNVSIRAFTNESNDMRYWSDSLSRQVTTSEDGKFASLLSSLILSKSKTNQLFASSVIENSICYACFSVVWELMGQLVVASPCLYGRDLLFPNLVPWNSWSRLLSN